MNEHLTSSEVMIAWIKSPGIEGVGPNVKDGRCYPYVCPAGKKTVGHGHVIRIGEDFSHGLTFAEADALLRKDLKERFEPLIHKFVKVPLNQHQFDALVSFVFNIGPGDPRRGIQGLLTSTLLRKLNVRDYKGAAVEFPKWNKGRVNGVLTVLGGLVKRRKWEQLRFQKPVQEK
ncbi:MAG: lysozyme [Candidatus Obscuribacterales bacterium]|nr:lysozyme [Candidatus Obscuribacterales bacterium]